MTQEQLIDLVEFYIQYITGAWMYGLLYAVGFGVAAILFRSSLHNLAGYVTFRFDRYVKVGTLIEYEGAKWRIKSAGTTQIVLENPKGFLSLPIKNWANHEFIILKDTDPFDSPD